jgi:hypothetical protein
MHAPTITAVCAFGAGLLATLVLAAGLTPRAWWRRPNACALAVLAGGTFAIGSALSWWFAPAALAARLAALPAEMLAPAAPAAPRYRAYDDLNLRTGTGVSAQRVAVVPAGAPVTPTGARKGDWWEVSARVGGREVRGWASSLWLRREDEGVGR